MANRKIPYDAEITEILLMSFDSRETIDLRAQMAEMTIYESLFAPFVKAELLINDEIGLFVNFPLTGEEFIYVKYRPTGEDSEVAIAASFVINSITEITSKPNARGYIYALNLVSRPAYENSKIKVSHAYSGLISKAAKDVFDDYIRKPAAALNARRRSFAGDKFPGEKLIFDDIEDSLDSRTVVIPNLRPMDAIKWLASRAVSALYNTNYLYLFWQTIDAFHFKTVQSLFTDENLKNARKKPYFFVSNIENKKGDTYFGEKVDERRSITNLYFDKRYSTLDKIVNGYFESNYFEINLYQNSWKDTPNRIQESDTKIDQSELNTTEYENLAVTDNNIYQIPQNNESYNRVHYAFNNAAEYDASQPLYEFRNKWSRANRTSVALDQINASITVEGDTDRKAGDVIYCLFPEMHGFNRVEKDSLVSGFYLVTDVKHIFKLGNRHTTVMRIHKDSYGDDIDSMEFRYKR